MTDLYCVKRFGALYPEDDATKAQLSKIGEGEVVRVKGFTRPRNYLFHKKFFAMINMVADGLDKSPDLVLKFVKITVGHFDEMTVDGKLVFVPKSISFSNMDQPAFDEFYLPAVKAAADLIGADAEDLRIAVEGFME